MNEELISELLKSLTEEETESLVEAIKTFLANPYFPFPSTEQEITLEGKANDLFDYFKELPYKYKSIFIFLFKSANKDNPKIEELNFLFEKKHIADIFAELNTLSDDVQKEFYDSIYIDIAPRYEYFIEKNKTRKRK